MCACRFSVWVTAVVTGSRRRRYIVIQSTAVEVVLVAGVVVVAVMMSSVEVAACKPHLLPSYLRTPSLPCKTRLIERMC